MSGEDRHGSSGVIWISGFSAAGKTTVGRSVEAKMRGRNASVVFLDGDDLRSILATKWGYDRSDRIELARVYFRLCSHLRAQGLTVIISAVAMYDEVRAWVRENVPESIQVFLDVSQSERVKRDQETKGVYRAIRNSEPLYDRPDNCTHIVDNNGTRTPDEVADEIITLFDQHAQTYADFGRHSHWKKFYGSDAAPRNASPFAEWVSHRVSTGDRLLEVGSGNGRDANYFAGLGLRVLGVDPSAEAILASRRSATTALFREGRLSDIANDIDGLFDVVYSRFVIHAMPLAEEESLYEAIGSLLRQGGQLFIECRSINDPLARQGETLSPTERIHGHYRRFIVPHELRDRLLRKDFNISEQIEASGLAPYQNEDPVVIRITATRE